MAFFEALGGRAAGARAQWRQRLSALLQQGAVTSLLRGAMWFWCAEILYTSFGSAFAYSYAGVQGVLVYMFWTQLPGVVSYLGNFSLMARYAWEPWQTYRAGVATMFLSLLAAGLLPTPFMVLTALAVIGGAGRGIAYSSRFWLELHHTQGAQRERYLSLAEAVGALSRLCIPVISGILLAKASQGTDNFGPLFAVFGVLGLAGCLLWFGNSLKTTIPGPLNLRQPFSAANFWRTAPFFMVDGAGLALRTTLFVSGAMAVVGSAANYSWVEASASCVAIGLLLWQARHPAPEPSLGRLRNNLLLLGFGWLMLLLALQFSVLLLFFVAAYALGTPLVSMVKSGLSMKAMALPGVELQDAMSSRMLLFIVGRLAVMGGCWALTAGLTASKNNIAMLIGMAILLMPLEYYFAKRLQSK
jgi:hypothetical protein